MFDTAAMDRQNAEFDALTKLVEAFRIHNTVAVVDDDYPEVRHKYEAALKDFLRICSANRPFDYNRNRTRHNNSILQPWVESLGLRHQGVIVSAMRGCDNAERDDASKKIQRLLRGAVLESHCGRSVKPASYIMTEPDANAWQAMVKPFIDSHDHYPNHYVLHFLHACEIIGYHGPRDEPVYSDRWRGVYFTLCYKFHINPETKEQLDQRLNADEIEFARLQQLTERA
jgi:hypothetical protein